METSRSSGPRIDRRAWLKGALGVGALALAPGCGGSEETAFAAGIDPLEPNTAVAPTRDPGSPPPEVIALASGAAAAYEWAHARGYLRVPLARAWDAIKEPGVLVDRRRVSEFTVTRNVEPEYAVSFRVHNVVHDIITIEFDDTHRQGVLEGDAQNPTAIVARSQKTSGSTFITLKRDSVILRRLDDQNTAVELIRQLRSTGTGVEEVETYIRDLYASILAQTRGEPLPRYG